MIGYLLLTDCLSTLITSRRLLSRRILRTTKRSHLNQMQVDTSARSKFECDFLVDMGFHFACPQIFVSPEIR